MIDDEDQKARRNLVMFSSGVLLLAWLEIPITVVVAKLGDALPAISPVRAWSAALIVLFYLAFRYHFNGEGKETLNRLQKRYAQRLQRGVEAVLQNEGRGLVFHTWWTPPLEGILSEAESKTRKMGLVASKLNRKIFFSHDEKSYRESPFSGEVSMRVVWHHPSGRLAANHSFQERPSYVLPQRLRWMLRVRGIFTTALYSEESPALLAPAVLSSCASFVVSSQLTAAFMESLT